MPTQDEMLQALDPFAAAALRQRAAVKPPLGREEGLGTKIVEAPGKVANHMLGGMLHLPQQSFENAARWAETGEYDPGPPLAGAMMATGGRIPFAGRGELGVGGGNPFTPGSPLAKAADRFLGSESEIPMPDWAATSFKNSKTPQQLARSLSGVEPKFNLYNHELDWLKQHFPDLYTEAIQGGAKHANPWATVPVKATETSSPVNIPVAEKPTSPYVHINKYEEAKKQFPGVDFANIFAPSHYYPSDTWKWNTAQQLPSMEYQHVWPIPPRATQRDFNIKALHGTTSPDPFDVFKLPEELSGRMPQLGFHFGSPRAAAHFSTNVAGEAYSPRTYPVLLQARKPLELPDFGAWGVDRMREGLVRHHPDLFTRDIQNMPLTSDPVKNMQNVRDLINKKGYDSVKYENAVEDPGHTSYILWDKNKVRSPWAAFKDFKSGNLLGGTAAGATMAPEVLEMIRQLQGQSQQ